MNFSIEQPLSLLLADDHALFLDAITTYIARAVPGAQTKMVENLDQIHRELESGGHYDLVLVDWHMPGVRDVGDLATLITAHPDCRFALMSGVVRPHDVWQVIELGFLGYIPKTLSGGAVVDAIRRIVAGETYIPMDPETRALFRAYSSNKSAFMPATIEVELRDPGLTRREQETLRHLAAGRTNQEIATAMELSVATVKMHLRHSFEKLGVRNRTEAVLRCREMGINDES